MKEFKRQYRELSDEHREKISQATPNIAYISAKR